jgi:hypothetical protein
MNTNSSPMQPVSSQTQTRDPWAPAQPFLQQLMGSAQSLYTGNVGYEPYDQQTQAQFTPGANQAMDTIAAYGLGNPESQGAVAGLGAGQNLINSYGLTPGIQGILAALMGPGGTTSRYGTMYDEASGTENPYLQSVIEASNRRIADKVNSAFSSAGRYGSGQHTDVASRAMAEAADPILAQDYEARQARRMEALKATAGILGQGADISARGINQAGQWAQLMPGLEQARFAPLQRTLGVEEARRALSQAQLDDNLRLWNAQQARPWEQLQRYSGIIGGAGGLGGTTVQASSQARPSTLQSILGGGAVGAGLGSAFGPWGTALGGLGGGLAGGFL